MGVEDEGSESGVRVRVLGHYEVSELLGAGGMGEVYLAHSPSGRAVAVKVIREELAERPGFRERFAREVAAACQVSGAFTAPVLDADTTGPVPWMATQYVPGPSLAARVAASGPLTADVVWQLGSGLAEALRDIHRVGLVHRDFKPGNILLAEDGPRVIDFGISRIPDATALTQAGELMGTPPFMAPEQFQSGRDAGPAADVFALGAVLVHAATAHGPFDADSPYAVAWKVVHEDPDLTGLPASLLPVVTACLAKDPAGRPDADALLTLLSSRRERRARVALAAVATRRLRVRRTALAAGAVVAAGALVAAVVVWWPYSDSKSPRGSLSQSAPNSASPRPSLQSPAPIRLAGWQPWAVKPAGDRPENDAPACVSQSSVLLCAGQGSVSGLDPLTGKTLWRQPLSGSVQMMGVTDTHVVVSDNTRHDNALRTFAVDSGKPGKQLGAASENSCMAIKEMVVCSGGAGVDAWDPADGKRLWDMEKEWSLGAERQFPAAPDTAIYMVRYDGAGNQEVAQVDSAGTIHRRYKAPEGTRFVTADPDGAFYVDSTGTNNLTSRVFRLDNRGEATQSIRLGEPATFLGAAGSTAYTITRDGVVSAYEMREQRLLWSYPTLATSVSPPTVQGNRVHLSTADGKVIALDRLSGSFLWHKKPPPDPQFPGSRPNPPPPLTLGDIIIASAPGGQIYSFDGSAP
ncbi:PQQ-binding-like beta-propeller repeat protein [Streptomyces sp. NPDC056544]|uniref:serine/threonine-protein kinase n=1 Tax=unclassified Streptomyces TaxID=2593676 RepID=UPI003681F730